MFFSVRRSRGQYLLLFMSCQYGYYGVMVMFNLDATQIIYTTLRIGITLHLGVRLERIMRH